MFRTTRNAAVTVALGFTALVTPAAAVPVLAAPAQATDAFPAWINNHTGRHLGGAKFSQGHSSCYAWNRNDDGHKNPKTFTCKIYDVKPHTKTGLSDDMDAFTVYSSGYYWVRWNHDSYHKVNAGTWTKFESLHTADCYSGPHVKCTITKF